MSSEPSPFQPPQNSAVAPVHAAKALLRGDRGEAGIGVQARATGSYAAPLSAIVRPLFSSIPPQMRNSVPVHTDACAILAESGAAGAADQVKSARLSAVPCALPQPGGSAEQAHDAAVVGTGDGDFAELAHPARTSTVMVPLTIAKADLPRRLRSVLTRIPSSQHPGRQSASKRHVFRDDTESHAVFDEAQPGPVPDHQARITHRGDPHDTSAFAITRRLTRRFNVPGSVVDRLVGGREEIEEDRQVRPAGCPLDHEDCRHVLGWVVVPDDAVSPVPSVAPGGGSEVGAPGADRHPETPAEVVKVPWREPGDRLLRRRQVIAGHQTATIGLVVEAMRHIVSAAIGVPEPSPSKARVPVASMWTSP